MTFVDLTIQFQGASGLPKMDVGGNADPYFVAKLDGKLTYTSSVQMNTLSPSWNEVWTVKNVPRTATLTIEVLDKDEGLTDDYIGQLTMDISSGEKEVRIEDKALKRNRGTFYLKVSGSLHDCPIFRRSYDLSYIHAQSRHLETFISTVRQGRSVVH